MADVMTTRKQREMMEHAIGHPAPRGSKPGWRNRYCTDGDDPDWNALVAAGLAVKRESAMLSHGQVWFFVTDAGFAELGLKPPKREASEGRSRG